MMVEEAPALIERPPPEEREMNELTRRTSTSTWLPWREAVDRVGRHLGYPTENARLRIVRKCSIEVHSATLRQVCPKPLIAREPATPGGTGAEPPLDPLIEVLKEMYPPNGDIPDVPARSDAQILGQIERGRPEFEDIFSEDSVNRARKQTRETALAASKK
jgi:hypothetical protein